MTKLECVQLLFKTFFAWDIEWTIDFRFLQISWHTAGNPDIPSRCRRSQGNTRWYNQPGTEANEGLIWSFNLLLLICKMTSFFYNSAKNAKNNRGSEGWGWGAMGTDEALPQTWHHACFTLNMVNGQIKVCSSIKSSCRELTTNFSSRPNIILEKDCFNSISML